MKIQTPADIAHTIRARRRTLERSQQSVADAVGITRQSLVRIERSQGATSFETVLRIFHELGITLHATTENTNAAAPQEPTQQATTKPVQLSEISRLANQQAARMLEGIEPFADHYASIVQKINPSISQQLATMRESLNPLSSLLPPMKTNWAELDATLTAQRTALERLAYPTIEPATTTEQEDTDDQ